MKHCPFTDPAILKIAKAHSVSAAQVCLRWILERGCTIGGQGHMMQQRGYVLSDLLTLLSLVLFPIAAVGTGSDPAKAKDYAKENLDLFGFSLTAAEVKIIDAMEKAPDNSGDQYIL